MDEQTWNSLTPQFQWRPSQQHIFELVAEVRDRRWHIAAPPGAGKTLIGLELARSVGVPTIVFSPTVAIREQWRAATGLFGAEPDQFSTYDPAQPAPLLSVTYQLLGNPGEAAAELRFAARRLWVADVAISAGLEAAEARICALESNDPDQARKELNRHIRALRRSLQGDEAFPVAAETLLGERASVLIEHLADSGIGCVILDECHHLLDWWAIVISALIDRLQNDREVAVVGLTATLPDPASSQEAANYQNLLGDVDAEMQLPALVAERAIAPWRDGVYVTRLTDEEDEFVDSWSATFERDIDDRLISEAFITWAVGQVTNAAMDARQRALDIATPGDPHGWDEFWNRDPLAAAALYRWWSHRGMSLPGGFDPPEDARKAFELDDRLLLIDAWFHDPLADIETETRNSVEHLLNQYGIAMTAGGIRWGRTVADLVCSQSEAKGNAAAEVIAREMKLRAGDARTLVVVERDRSTTPPARVRELLGEDAGTASRVLASLCDRPEVVSEGIIAVTGRGAWADAVSAQAIANEVNIAWSKAGLYMSFQGCEIRNAVQLVGEGPGWTSTRWLDVAELLLENGTVQTVLGTRALVGEGWDCPSLNVLVDLSEDASRVASTQVRGRAIRLDPKHPDKIASLWDVVVAHPTAHGEWSRLQRRHAGWWGPDGLGSIVTGAGKLHPMALAAAPPNARSAATINEDSLIAVSDVETTRLAWGNVESGGGTSTSIRLVPRRRRTVKARPKSWRSLYATSAAGAVVAAASIALSGPVAVPITAVGVSVAGIAFGASRRRGEKDTLAALGEAARAGLVAAGTRGLDRATVSVDHDETGAWRVSINAGDKAAEVWAAAFAEAMGPLGSPRWLLVAGDEAWRVPAAVGSTAAAAREFTSAFRRRVPSVHLVRAGTPEATVAVLAAQRSRPDDVIRMQRWR